MKIAVLSDSAFSLTPSMLMRIDDAVPNCELLYRAADSVTAEQLSNAEIIFGCPPVDVLRSAVKLKWHNLPNAAIQPYTSLALYADSSVTLTNSSGVYGASISEHVVAFVFSFARCLPLYAKQQREHLWSRDDDGCVWIEGSTASIFGTGDLGSHIAAKLKALGMNTIGIRRSLLDKPQCIDELYDLRHMDEALRRADFTVCCLPLTNITRGLFSEWAFSMMKPSSFFINVGRGAIVDNGALASALMNGTIAGAALDVTDPEPLPHDSVLWDIDNLIITPHSSCVSPDVQERKLELFLEQLDRYVSGKRLKNVVSFIHGY